MIDVQNMTLTYPGGKGVFDLSFRAEKGQIVGCLGPNGAGKTTTIRALLGFMKPNTGSCSIRGLNCWSDASRIQTFLGYIPGEISLIEDMHGDEYLSFIHRMRGNNNQNLQPALLDLLDLDPRGSIRRFSKGMKQKLAIVTAFMHDPSVLILDEPTSGLDPLIQNHFLDYLLQERERGKTIFLSSHRFDEVERTCDKVIMIKDGRIISQSDIETLNKNRNKRYLIRSESKSNLEHALLDAGFNLTQPSDDWLEVNVTGDQTNLLISILSRFPIIDLDIKQQTLEEIFMHFYQRRDA